MNAKGNLILLVIVGLFLAALVSRNGAFGLMAFPFLVYFAAGLATSPGEIRLQATRTLDCVRCREDSPVTMIIQIRNNGEAIPLLRIVDPAFPEMRVVEGGLSQRVSVPAGGEVELKVVFYLPRGRFEWNSIQMVASDSFGLFEQSIKIPSPVRLLVNPEPIRLRRFQFRPRNTLHTPGPNLSRLAGCGVDFFGIREYRPGDSLRLIHWRMAARHPRNFFAKEFEREEMADIGLILDTRGPNPRTDRDAEFFDHAIQATAALAKNFLSVGNRVSFLAMGENIIRVFPGYGKRQLVKILDHLARCKPAENLSLDTLRYFPVRLFPSHALIVLITPLCQQDYSTIARLRADGYQILVVSPNPVRFAINGRKADVSGALAQRLVMLERAILIWRIQQIGVEVVDWQVDQPLDQAIRCMRKS